MEPLPSRRGEYAYLAAAAKVLPAAGAAAEYLLQPVGADVAHTAALPDEEHQRVARDGGRVHAPGHVGAFRRQHHAGLPVRQGGQAASVLSAAVMAPAASERVVPSMMAVTASPSGT